MKKFKLFKQSKLVISNKIIASEESFIQIRNITRIWHGKLNLDIPYFKLLIIISVSVSLMQTPFSFIGFLLLLIFFVIIGYYLYLYNLYTLNFELSSSEVYAFTSLKKEFLINSYEKIKHLIENDDLRAKDYIINFNSCEIIHGDNNKILKDNNIVVNKGDNSTFTVNQTDNSSKTDNSIKTVTVNNKSNNKESFNTKIEYNFDAIYDDLSKLLEMPAIKSNEKELELIKKARNIAKKKDENKLKEIVSKLGKSTIHVINTVASLATLADFIRK